MKSRIYFSLPVFLLLYLNSYSQAPYLSWAGNFTTNAQTSASYSRHLAYDNNRNCILTMQFGGTVDFDMDTTSQFLFTSAHPGEESVCKYSPAGTLEWAHHFPVPGQYSLGFRKVQCDSNNDIILLGNYGTDTIDVDPSPAVFNLVPVNGVGGYFIMKLDAAGNFQWAFPCGNQPGLNVNQLKLDEFNNIYLCGSYNDTIDFDFGPGVAMDTLGSSSNADGFIVKMDPSGNYLWHRSFKAITHSANLYDLDFDEDGNIYSTGSIQASVDFDPGPGIHYLNSTGAGFDAFILKLNSSGNFVRVWKVGSNGFSDGGQQIIYDKAGHVYVRGYWYSTMDFDPGPGVYNLTSTSSSNDDFVVKMDTLGHGMWVIKTGSYPDAITKDMSYDPINGIFVAGNFNVTYDFDPSPLTATLNTNGSNDIYFTNFDINGNFKRVFSIGSVSYENIWAIRSTPEGVLYASGYFNQSADFDPGAGQYILTASFLNSQNGFLLSLNQNANFVSGKAFRDMNLNATFDASDFNLNGTVIHTSQGKNFITNNNGNYVAQIDTGTSTVTYANLPVTCNSVPVSHVVSNTSYNNFASGKDFAIQVPSGVSDAGVSITNLNATRAGRPSYISLSFENNGSTTVSGTVKFVKNNSMTNLVSSITPSVTSADTTWWNFSNLLPNETRSIQLTTTISAAVSAGTILPTSAELILSAGDIFPSDNTDSLNLIITASLDPNDKQVIPDGGFSTQQITNGEYLNYIIHFQNTGNDTAFIVQIVDTLSSFLDVSSFEVVGASHPYSVQLTGSNVIRFVFENILLPDSSTNEALSHGFIRYKIKPQYNLQPGISIENTAFIYFDFNTPVQTNIVSNPIILPNLIHEMAAGKEGFSVFPNPSSGIIIIENKSRGAGSYDITVNDAMGKTIISFQMKEQKKYLNLGNQKAGIYSLIIRSESGVVIKKIIHLN